MYNWKDVAERTEKVYERISNEQSIPLIDRLSKYYGCGTWAGKIFCMIVALNFILWQILEWLFPREDIEIAVDFPYEEYNEQNLKGLSDYEDKKKS